MNKAYSEYSDREIIEKVLAGETREYRALVEKYKQFVFAITVKILNNEEEAEEAAQDAFIKGFQALRNFSQRSKFTTWLYRIAFNTAISYKRKHRIEVSGIEEVTYKLGSGYDTSQGLNREDQVKFIEIGLKRLPQIDAVILTLFYLKEFTLDEISKITELKTNAIKVKLFRARKKLADELKSQLSTEAVSLI